MPNTLELRVPCLQGATLRYRVIIDGVQPDHTLEQVAARLAELFRRTAGQMQTLLAAPRAIVKKQLDCSHALRFQAALRRAGCIAVIEPDITDFSTLVLCHHVSPGPGIAINTPEAWLASSEGDTFQLLDQASGIRLRAVGVTSAALPIRDWADQRLRRVAEDMPYLRQVRAPYRMAGAGWGERVQGVAAEYRGTLPGTDAGSHYLVLSLRSARSLVWLTVHAPAAVFDANEALLRWLLSTQLDVCDAAPAPVPQPQPQRQPAEPPPVPQPVALAPHDEALQRWLRYNEARPSRRLQQSRR